MTLGAALGWKYDNAPGICTVGGVLTSWPPSLGHAPDETEQASIIAEYEAFSAEPKSRTPTLYAIAHLTIEDGSVSSVTPSAKIGGAFYIEPGTYWAFFAETQPDTDYIPLCYNHDHAVFVTEKYEDFFVISATSGGVPSDPPSISVEIKRVI